FVDNNIVLFLRKKDSLCVYTLRDKQMKWIPDVRSYQVGKNGDKKYLISLLANGNLVITGFENGERHEFAAVNDFRLAFEDSVIVLTRLLKDKDQLRSTLDKVNLSDFRLNTFWSTNDSLETVQMSSIVVDGNHRQIAFKIQNRSRNSIWHYKIDSNKVKC